MTFSAFKNYPNTGVILEHAADKENLENKKRPLSEDSDVDDAAKKIKTDRLADILILLGGATKRNYKITPVPQKKSIKKEC